MRSGRALRPSRESPLAGSRRLHMRLKLTLLTTLACLVTLAAAGTARAAMTVTYYKIISSLQPPPFSTVVPEPPAGPSTLQAGANPDAGSWSQYAYPNSTEDIRTALTNFAPGLLGDPTSVPRCPEANLQTDTCPADTQIGTSRLDTGPSPGGSPIVQGAFGGTIYNAVPLANEPGRLGV